MKTIYLTLLLIVSYSLHSQNESYSKVNAALDSTYYYENISNDLRLTDKYIVLDKTGFGKTRIAIQLFYNGIQNTWINHFSDTIKYFENQDLSESIRKLWDIDHNLWIDCEYTRWNEQGDKEDTYKINRIYGIPEATSGNRQFNSFDENHNLIQSLKKGCGDDLIWYHLNTQDYVYDEDNRLVTYVFDSITKWEYLYNENSLYDEIFISLHHGDQGWDTTWHHVFTYLDDLLIEDLVYEVATNRVYARDTFQYDFSENITLRYEQLWDTNAQSWETILIEKQKQNINNLLIEHSYYNPSDGVLTYLYEYDANDNLLEYKRQYGDSVLLIDDWKYLYTYTENNNLLEQDYYEFDEDNNTWLLETKLHHYWSIMTSIPEINEKEVLFDIYPNPCSQFLFVKCNHLQAYSIKIFDLEGKLKYSNDNNSKVQILDLSYLNRGVYIVTIAYNGKNEQKIIILE